MRRFEHAGQVLAQQLRDELRVAGMPHETPVRVRDGYVEIDWPGHDVAIQHVLGAHRVDARHAWPRWKRELHDLLTEAEHRTLDPNETQKVDQHMKTLARHSLDNEARHP